uniref:VP n=1 Tax=uncultured densovirus TaxID=748192 RepID=A0A7L7YQM6_9VIRU|nr:VP [uncultured densovirus]
MLFEGYGTGYGGRSYGRRSLFLARKSGRSYGVYKHESGRSLFIMSHVVSADGHWQWNGHRWKRVVDEFGNASQWNSEEIEWLNENQPIYERNQPLDPEQIELDEIELNTAEDTPLLESGVGLAETGGVSAVGAAAAPSTASVATAAVIAGATIIGGVTTGILSSDEDHRDPTVGLPGHHYVGPGNTISDTSPVDTDDSIARHHDIAYENAQSQQDIQDADRESASDFLTDVIHNNNLHSAVGYVGLKAKETVESAVGVQYPPNLPPSVSGMSGRDIARMQRRFRRARARYDINRDPSRHPDFPTQRGRQNYAWSQWNHARQNHGLPRVEPPPRLGINVTQRPRTLGDGSRRTNDALSYRDWKTQRRNGPVLDVLSDLSSDEQNVVEEVMREADGGGSISIADFDNRDGAGPSNAGDMASHGQGAGTKRIRLDGGDDIPSSGSSTASAVPAAAPGGTGHNSGSDGGFDSAQGPESYLMKGGYSAKGGMMRFTKVHRMKSWAIPYINVTDATDRGGTNFVTTPLAKIPWEYAFFYLSQEEFNLLPAGSYIDSVHIKVMQTVASTGYPTGGTTADIATTNHPKVLVIGKDLEKKCRGGVDRTLTLSSNMIPSVPTDPAAAYADFVANQYGTDQTSADASVVVPGVAHKIPFYNKTYFCIYQPNRAQALTRSFFTETNPGVVDENFAPGFEYFQNYITEVNSNDTTWDHVDGMSYKFENAPIGEQYRQLEILTDEVNNATGNALYYNAKRNITGMFVNGNTKFTESIRPSERNSIPIVTYKSAPMEKGCYFVRGDKAGKPSRQPTYHIGMRAIDKLAPEAAGSRATSFVQANIEFEIQATMIVNLPSYPNRFVRPKFYNTSVENTAQGIGAYPSGGKDRVVTFGLYNETATAPAVAPVDQVGSEPTEGDMETRPRRLRPRRSVPYVPTAHKKKK